MNTLDQWHERMTAEQNPPNIERAAWRAVLALHQHAHDTRQTLKALGYPPTAQSSADTRGAMMDELTDTINRLNHIADDIRQTINYPPTEGTTMRN